jgi:hypothetical protein
LGDDSPLEGAGFVTLGAPSYGKRHDRRTGPGSGSKVAPDSDLGHGRLAPDTNPPGPDVPRNALAWTR